MSTASPEVCPGLDSLAPEYEILGELGRGGMAVVHLARERQLDRDVAIKLIRARWIDDAEVLARFAREARLVAGLEHPNIVRLYSVRHLPGAALALIMQYVPGLTLKEEVLRSGPLAPARAERVLREVAAALACAHSHGIVHRDVKPDNIFIDERDGTALLADFGVARPLAGDAQVTVAGMAMGTPAYMSPEQIDGSGFDARSDLYSLGLVGWELLTGETPWEGESFYSVLHKQKTTELPSLRKLRPDAPARLRTAIEVAIRKRPADRWVDVAEFLTCLNGGAEPAWRTWVRTAADSLTTRVAPARPVAVETAAQARAADPVAALATVVYPRPDPAAVAVASAPDGASPAARLQPTTRPDATGDEQTGPPVAGGEQPALLAQPDRSHDSGVSWWSSLASHLARLRFADLLERRWPGEHSVRSFLAAVPVPRTAALKLELMSPEQREVDAERQRLEEWLLLRARLDRRTVADAGEHRHPHWALYPHGLADYAALLTIPSVDAPLAALLMETYGALDVLLGDLPIGVERRTGGRIRASQARALLENLRLEERRARNEE
jgi:serine/threonine protein kinase